MKPRRNPAEPYPFSSKEESHAKSAKDAKDYGLISIGASLRIGPVRSLFWGINSSDSPINLASQRQRCLRA